MSIASSPHGRWYIRALDLLLWPVALVAVLLEALIWRGAVWLGRTLSGALRLPALAQRLGRLPAACAVPLFLVPELASRAGTLWAAWLLMESQFQAATFVYAGSKLFASVIAIWIYRACEPALLRVAWFAKGRQWLLDIRDWAMRHVLGAVRPGLRHSRFAERRARVAHALVRFVGPRR